MSEANKEGAGSPAQPVVQTREDSVGPDNADRSDDVPLAIELHIMNLEMLVGRLCRRIDRAGTDKVSEQAKDYLARKGMRKQSILREQIAKKTDNA